MIEENEQISLHDSALARLDIHKVHKLIVTPGVSFKFDTGLSSPG